jgi:hypothetical protein
MLTTELDDFSEGLDVVSAAGAIEYPQPGTVAIPYRGDDSTVMAHVLNERQAMLADWASGMLRYWADREIELMDDIIAANDLTDDEKQLMVGVCGVVIDKLLARDSDYLLAILQTRH